jgi:predicted dehydrogenase
MAQLGVGIIGAGNISTAYLSLAPLFKSLRLVSVADINMASAQAQAVKFGIRADTVDDMLKAADVDVIVNLTVPAVHYQVSKAILMAGKHAYSEKPVVLTLDEGRDLQDIAAARGLRLGSAPDTFLGGAHQLARAAIDNGTVGRVVGGTCHFMGYGMEHWHPNPDFFYAPGGGPVLDMGPYYITNLVQLIGPVKTVASLANAPTTERTISNGPRNGEKVKVTTATNVHALLEFASGATVTLGVSWDVPRHRHPNMELYGTETSIYVPDPNFFGGAVQLGPRTGDLMDAGDSAAHPFGIVNMKDGGQNGQANYRCAGLADMAAAIDEGRQHRCNDQLAVHVVDVMTSILRAGAERRFVDLTTTCERPAALSADQARALLV